MITNVAFVTYNRPDWILRGLRSAVSNLDRHGRDCEIVVYDDADEDGSETLVDRLRESFPQGRLRYCGPREKRLFVSELVRAAPGIDPDVLAFGLLRAAHASTSVGANRNLWLLDTIDTASMTLDDDVECRVGRIPGYRPGLCITDSPEIAYWLHETRSHALSTVELEDEDIVGLHELALGKDIESTARTLQVEPTFVTPQGTPDRESVRVVVTTLGLVGDGGVTVPSGRLALDGASRERLVGPHYEALRLTREAVRGVCVATIYSAPWLMLPCAALDNTELLPPFMPLQRGEDGLFAATLRKACPSARLFHAPYAIVHTPEGRAPFQEQDLSQPVRHWTIESVLHGALAVAPSARTTPQAWLERLGHQLQEVARPPRCTAFVDGMLRAMRREQLERLSARLDRHGGLPAAWARDVRMCIQAARQSLASPVPMLPGDLGFLDPDASVATARFLSLYGAWLHCWPSVRSAALGLRASGIRPSRPLNAA